MKIQANAKISASREEVWKTIIDIENSANFISGIEKVSVLEKPDDGLVGFKWEETRKMFGQTAVEVMWVTDVVEGESYCVEAENNGAKYYSTHKITDAENGVNLMMAFEGIPITFFGKVMAFLTGFIFRGATEKAFKQDLMDIKSYVESQ